MRIILFPKLIKDEETTQVVLKDCSLVIDGNNFFYNCYEDNKLNYVFGSEANRYSRVLWKMLNKFKKANIKLYVVFKGGDTDIEKKLKRLEVLNTPFSSFVAPVFLKEISMQVLEESGVNYATCIAESKNECVALAQKLGCPVLSNDVEFCFRRALYIPHATLDYTKQNQIPCKQYKLEHFLSKHSLTERKAAIFAVLSDVNIFPQHHFDNLLKTWAVCNSSLYIQNKNLLEWLSEHSEDEAVDAVLKFLSNDIESKKFLMQVEKILNDMQDEQEGLVTQYLYNDCKLTISQSDPLWFEKGVVTKNIALYYINLYNYKLVSGSRAIEKTNSTDSIMLSMDIIKYAYNLLTNFKTSNISVYRDAENCVSVSTEDSNIAKPTYKELVFQDGWKDIKNLKLFEHFVSEIKLKIHVLNKLPSEARMMFIALAYSDRKKTCENIDLTKEIYCFIISYVMLYVVHDKDNSLRKKRSGINAADSATAIQVTKNYFFCDNREVMKIFNGDTLKTLVELQYCLLYMNTLNTLCGAPYKTTKYHRTFNGTFIYKLLHDMADKNENDFVEALFRTAPSVLSFINMLLTTYKELVSN